MSIIVQLNSNKPEFQKQPLTKVSQNRCFYFSKFKWKHLRWSLFSIPVTLLRKDFCTCILLRFYEFFKNSFFTEHFRTTTSGFLIHFTAFGTLWTNKSQSFSIFENILSWLLNVINIMNSNDLVVLAWEQTFLDDITRNLVALYRLITEFLYSAVLQLFNYLPEHLIRCKTKLTL